MKEYKRLTEKGVLCSVASHRFGGKHEQYYYRLYELEDKIENGTLVELPCKVGDTVFTIEGGIIEEHEVMGILVQFEELFFKILRKRDLVCKFWGSRSVFLTKAEAESKLVELR